MSELDYAVEPEVECLNNDPDDAAFVRATATIKGHDAIKEYVAWKVYSLAASIDFENVPLGMTPMSKVEASLLLFAVESVASEHADRALAEIEMETEKVLGSFGPKEHNALRMANIPNGGRLNWVLEQMGVSYAPHPLPGSKASQAAIKKRKAELSKKLVTKKAKAGLGRATPSKSRPNKKISILKTT
jgi:hypothetical protein